MVEELRDELKGLSRFVTLSPVPGFRGWLEKEADNTASETLSEDDRIFVQLISVHSWGEDHDADQSKRNDLEKLAARYFLHAKHRSGLPYDPVARFHLGNGARLERINWMGDRSEKGLNESYGLMVNYDYVLDQIERNHEAFSNDSEVVVSKQVRSLAG